jgi:ATP-binding cassette subfamily C (CFTR/MRP) protein 1
LLCSVERVLHYGDLPQEDTIKSPFEPPPSWPEKGEIEFKDVKLRYRDGLPLVLKGLSFKVRAGEHVGVVGRTGAGKTSILSALFRLVNPPYVEGSVVIDGVDVHTIALETLRHRLSIIPQDGKSIIQIRFQAFLSLHSP